MKSSKTKSRKTVEKADIYSIYTNGETNDLLKRAIQYRQLGDYGKAQEYFDKIIEDDPENHLVWYEKSKLPIVQDDTIVIKNRTLSLSAYQQHSLPDKSNYLQQCGFEITELQEIENQLSISNLLSNQRKNYLKMAISCAPDNVKLVYLAELENMEDVLKEKGQKDIKAVIVIGLIALSVSIATVLVFNVFPHSSFLKIFINRVILILVPYALSVTGLTLYTKAKNNGNSTVAGLVCNLIALIISNLIILGNIFLYFSN